MVVPKEDTKFNLSRQMTMWLCRDLLPFNTVNTDAFKSFALSCKMVKSEKDLPTSATVSRTALEDVYRTVYGKLIAEIKMMPKILSMTFDFWTDRYKRASYVTFTCHWMIDYKLKSVTLKTEAFPHPHKGDDIRNAFQQLLAEFKLMDKTIIAVTDGGTNIIKACRLLNLKRLPCVAHSLHNIIMKDLMKSDELVNFRTIISKVKKLLMALTYKSADLEDLYDTEQDKKISELINCVVNLQEVLEAEENLQFDSNSKETELFNRLNDNSQMTSLKNDNITRWNSTLLMLESVVKNKKIIEQCLQSLRKYDFILEDDEIEKCEEMVAVLRTFVDATDFLQGQKYPTLNTVLIFLIDIKKTLQDILKENVSDFSKKIVTIVLAGIEKRLAANDFIVAAAFLDPAMKKLAVISEYLEKNDTTIVEILKKMQTQFILAAETEPVTVQSEKEQSSIPRPPSKTKRIRLELLQRHIDAEANNAKPSLEVEVTKYTLIEGGDTIDDPLNWWKENAKHFPQLSKLANILLSIPATSAPSERAFSAAGLLIAAKRSRLHPIRAKQTLFIHDNFDVLFG